MRAMIVALFCVSVVWTSAARADIKVGTWAPDIEAKQWKNTDEPISLYECRGMVVVLFFWVTWHPGGEYIIPLMNLVSSEFGRQQGVYMIGLTDAEMKRVDEMLKNEHVLFPVGTESKSYEEYEITSFPRVVVIDPKGKVAWTGWPAGGEGTSLLQEIRKVVADEPPTRTHPLEAAEARRNLTQTRQALREGDFRKAYRTASSAFGHALTGDSLKTECQDMVDLVEALGRDKYAQAEQAIEDHDFATAVTDLRAIIRDFRGADVARSANRKLRTIKKKYEEVAKIMEQRKDEGLAENELYDAFQLLRARKFGAAYEKLDNIISEYEGTTAAGKAETVLERVRKNTGIMDYVDDYLAAADCRTWLSQADAFKRAGRINQAKEVYTMVVEKYPNTVWADRAREELAQLR